ncbi:hypothetical protein NX059_006893 [Plenodomus lindquistii]|nr:hypothetical protein NX059_006893 [Plenodomus lindquistii]
MMNYDENLAGTDFEDSAAFAKAENDIEVAAVAKGENNVDVATERIRLPIPPASELAIPLMAHEDPSDGARLSTPSTIAPSKDEQIAAVAKKLRRQKSSKLREGVFHAHEFAKSVGKVEVQSWPDLLNIEWLSKGKDAGH